MDDVQAAVALAEAFEIPTAAWRVHATAAELYRRSSRAAAAEAHRARAEAIVRGLVDSFDAGEPLGRSLLDAAAARGILGARSAERGR